MVVPFAAGGPMDMVGRIMAPRLSEQLGQQVIIENVGGGGGMIGTARVAKAAPDGYQFVLGNVGTHAVSQSLYEESALQRRRRFRAGRADRRPVAGAGHAQGPARRQSAGVHRPRESEPGRRCSSARPAPARQRISAACCSTPRSASTSRTSPIAAAAPAMQDMIAGRIDYICIDTPSVISQIESGEIKAMAVLVRAAARRACRR